MKARDLKIEPCNLLNIRQFVEAHHYSHNVNGVKVSACFRVLFNGSLVGGVVFGALSTTAWKKFADSESSVLELRRLVLVDEAERNSESRVIGFCLRWIKKHLPQVRIIVSYADPYHGHSGIIYKASNFEFIGMTSKDKLLLDEKTGKTYHSRALRTKYKGDFKPFVKRLRDMLSNGELKEIEVPGKYCYVYKMGG